MDRRGGLEQPLPYFPSSLMWPIIASGSLRRVGGEFHFDTDAVIERNHHHAVLRTQPFDKAERCALHLVQPAAHRTRSVQDQRDVECERCRPAEHFLHAIFNPSVRIELARQLRAARHSQ
jgi:hypothetical protein